jgi:hypothetical protein
MMINRLATVEIRRRVYIWIALAIVIAVFVSVVHLFRNHANLAVVGLQAIVYSCMFGFLGWQQYKWNRDRQSWNETQRRGQSWGRLRNQPDDREESEDAYTGWR